MKISAVFLMLILSASFAQAGERIDKIAGQLNSALQCTNRIWPGLKKESYKIVFVQPSVSESWFWDGNSGKVESISKSEFSAVTGMPKYFFGEYRGNRAVFINLDEASEKSKIPSLNIDSAVETAIHEGFHFLFQMKEPWVAQFASADRKANLDHVNAVYLRRMLIKSLKSELMAGQSFGHSAYWFQKWEALGEAAETKLSDILEGTANYVEVIASIIVARGCQVPESELLKIALSNLDFVIGTFEDGRVMKEIFRKYVETGYQIEGYEIGLLSLLAMRAQGVLIGSNEYEMGRDFVSELQGNTSNEEKLKVMGDLQSALARVRTPAEILLRTVAPVADSDDLNLMNLIKQAATP